jgi:catechol 2,3-dioxygenase-like lactoylglutathione lyase family enzyme
MKELAKMAPADSGHVANPRLRVAYPQLFVADVARSATFYTEKLGFSISYLYGEPPFYGSVARDGVGINLRHVDAPVLDREASEREILLGAYVVVEGVDALFREFQGRGVTFAQTLKLQPYGMKEFVLRDIDGNLIAFASDAG